VASRPLRSPELSGLTSPARGETGRRATIEVAFIRFEVDSGILLFGSSNPDEEGCDRWASAHRFGEKVADLMRREFPDAEVLFSVALPGTARHGVTTDTDDPETVGEVYSWALNRVLGEGDWLVSLDLDDPDCPISILRHATSGEDFLALVDDALVVVQVLGPLEGRTVAALQRRDITVAQVIQQVPTWWEPADDDDDAFIATPDISDQYPAA
jgi:hypothetical protein